MARRHGSRRRNRRLPWRDGIEAGGFAEDEGGGSAGRFEEADSGGGLEGLVVGVFEAVVVEGFAALIEGVDRGDGALGGDDILAEKSDFADGRDALADFGTLAPFEECVKGNIVEVGEIRERAAGIEEGGEEVFFEAGGNALGRGGGDGLSGGLAAETVLVHGFVGLGEGIAGGPGAREVAVFGEADAGEVGMEARGEGGIGLVIG